MIKIETVPLQNFLRSGTVFFYDFVKLSTVLNESYDCQGPVR